MKRVDSYPLTAEHLAKLDQVLSSCAQTQAMIDKCKAAGLDVSQAETENQSQQQLATALKASFFPGST